MSKLFPVMSSMFNVFHRPLVSTPQAIWHVWPSLKMSPGAGARGVTSARTKRDDEARRAVRASDANITKLNEYFFFSPRSELPTMERFQVKKNALLKERFCSWMLKKSDWL